MLDAFYRESLHVSVPHTTFAIAWPRRFLVTARQLWPDYQVSLVANTEIEL